MKGIQTPLQSWDPYKCTGAQSNMFVAVYNSLTRETPEGTFEPALAESWEYETPTKFVMTLRDGVAFKDGTPLNANVVKANLERSVATPTGITSQFAANKPQITVISDLELAIDLDHPDPDLPFLFSSCGGMMAHPDLVAAPDRMVNEVNGTGPYNFEADASIAASSYVFNKKDNYWNSEAYPFSKVTFSVIPDNNSMINALVSGQVDIVPGNFQGVAQAESAGMAHVLGNVSPFSILLNDRAGKLVPALADERVRQALNYAVDRDAVIKTLFGENGVPTPQIPAEGVPGYDSALNDRYPYDPNKARELLAEAGYADGFSMPVLTTTVHQFDAFLSAVANYWGEIGVNVTQEVKDPSTYLSEVLKTNYPATVYPLKGAPPYSILNKFFGPNANFNTFKSTDAEFSEYMGKAAGGDETALRDASAQLLDMGWYVSAGFDAQYYFFNPKKVTGLEMLTSENTPLFYNWQPAT
ncbi:ABC transporter substrate-binding protein [Pseudarthrobacter raffinosi]|uniref:ABC transporter substrate-binding protein n=1 Tax=Pseudarthrobacter raffinosi TaxID=2953651 RepID=UPI00208FEF70|nr:ABC transporter substrate-binding protein [Pseudarthrobacter sp. MDT3-9]MCO4252137.1 ABC transporter substrate-binding protein [Pseudarthrobacter sp. MDT3-9]